MNQKEVSQLRRRFRPDKNAIRQVHGCYVNGKKEIIAYIDAPLGVMPQEEAEQYLGLLKKALSGTVGRNLIDLSFTTRQVMDSPEHRLLTALRDSGLKNGTALQEFYQQAIAALDMDGSNYLLLLAHDSYDVPFRGKDGQAQAEASDRVFSYLVCAVCPVKDGKLSLGFCAGENEFHNCLPSQLVAPPELGFLFPAFHDGAADLYHALFYAKKPEQLHQEFIDALFRTQPPLSAAEQREAFEDALSLALGEACSLEVVQAVHERLRQRIVQHRQEKDPEPLTLPAEAISAILLDCQIPQAQADAFLRRCEEHFGPHPLLNPANLIDSGKYQVETAQAKLSVDPELSCLVEARTIDGRPYLLLPADQVAVNGIPVHVQKEPNPIPAAD